MYHELSRKAEAVLNQQIRQITGEDMDFTIHYWGMQTHHYDNPVHKHSFFEICYVMDGEGEYIDDGETFLLQSGVLICSRPEVWHQIRSQLGLFLLFVAFHPEDSEHSEDSETSISAKHTFTNLAQTGKVCVLGVEESPTVLLWKALLLQASQYSQYLQISQASQGSQTSQASQESATNRLLDSLAYNLLASFPQMFMELEKMSVKLSDRTDSSLILYQAKLFIRDNLSRTLQLEQVAEYLHISGRQLSRLFSERRGQTFTNYVRQERLQYAILLLGSTNKSIKQIANEAGFETVHYFTRIFTKEIGTPPGRYREGMGTQFLN